MSASTPNSYLPGRDYFEPVPFERLHGLYQQPEVRRLDNVRVGAQVISPQNILFGIGGRKDHHRDPPEPGDALDLLQRLMPVLSGHLQVEEYEARLRRRSGVGVLASLLEVIQQFRAIFDRMQVYLDPPFFERVPDEQAVVGIIIGQKQRSDQLFPRSPRRPLRAVLPVV